MGARRICDLAHQEFYVFEAVRVFQRMPRRPVHRRARIKIHHECRAGFTQRHTQVFT